MQFKWNDGDFGAGTDLMLGGTIMLGVTEYPGVGNYRDIQKLKAEGKYKAVAEIIGKRTIKFKDKFANRDEAKRRAEEEFIKLISEAL